MPDHVTIPRELFDEIADELGGLGLCTPGAQLTASVIADCADLRDRLDLVSLDQGVPA